MTTQLAHSLSLSLSVTYTHSQTVQFAHVSKAHNKGSRGPRCNFLEGGHVSIQQDLYDDSQLFVS